MNHRWLFLFTLGLVLAPAYHPAVPVFAREPTVPESKFYARRYLSETEAVRLQVARQDDRVRTRTLRLSDTEVEAIRRSQRVKMFTNTYTVHALYHRGDEEPYRFAVPLKQPGQHEYMDLMYGVDPDGTVHRIDLMVYREPHGGEVQQRRFMRQFEGRSLDSSQFRVNLDVIHIAGATISSHSVARGTRKVLALLRQQGFTR